MASTESFLRAVSNRTSRYNTEQLGPNDKVRAQMRNKKVVVFMGPSGIGKNEQQERVERSPGGLIISKMQPVTTRPKRPGEEPGKGPYMDFLPADDATVQEQIIDNLDRGAYVQAATHPETRHFYASTADAYADSPAINFADFMGEEFVKLARARLFGSIMGIYLVAEDNHQWLEMWMGRDSKLSELDKRLGEADSSLNICLTAEAVVAGSITYVANGYRDDGVLPMQMVNIISGETDYDDSQAYGLGVSMQSFIQGMRAGLAVTNNMLTPAQT